jgi:hypothetical protein
VEGGPRIEILGCASVPQCTLSDERELAAVRIGPAGLVEVEDEDDNPTGDFHQRYPAKRATDSTLILRGKHGHDA